MKLKLMYVIAVIAGSSLSIAHGQTTKKKQAVTTQKTSAQSSKKPVKKATASNTLVLKNEKDSLSYALGTDVARSLKASGFDLDVKMLTEGITQQLKGSSLLMTEEKSAEVIQASVRKMREIKNAELRKPGEDFLAKNKLNPNIKVTSEGVQYEILKAGDGMQPTAMDEVLVHYLGTLSNGEKFDSTYDRNQPLTLSLTSVIRGWQIGIPLMRAGAKYRFFIPYNLAYGERGSGAIPPFSTLIFEVELLEVKGKEIVQNSEQI